jgi:hypothetical protein
VRLPHTLSGSLSHALLPRARHSCGAPAPSARFQLPAAMTMSPMSPTSPTPSILIQNDSGSLHRYPLPVHRRPSHPHSSASMAIPRARDEAPPPPLPPPRYIGDELTGGHDIGWQFGNRHGFRGNQLASVKPGSSLLGGAASFHPSSHNRPQQRIHTAREPSNSSSIDDMSSESLEHSDDDRSGNPRPTLANYRYVWFLPTICRLSTD